jgi:type II secretory pathway pseudopilin PulG
MPTIASRRGITLLEVLISIGILAIGLSSVVALVPAGRSQASRAVMLDRAAVLAANVLADAATFGLLRPDSLTVPPVSGTAAVIDADLTTSTLPNTAASTLRNRGVFSTGTVAPVAAPIPPAILRLFTQSRDDVTVDSEMSADDPPLAMFADGIGSFVGRMTALVCLSSGPTADTPSTVSVVVFHGRDPSLPFVTATVANNVAQVTGNLDGRNPQDIVKPGVVLWDGSRFHQLINASFTTGTAGPVAFLMLSTGTTLNGTVHFLPDSVGLAERPYLPETASLYTQ